MAAMRHEELSEEELARKRAVERSWEIAQRALADPTFRKHLEESIERVNRSSESPMTRNEFLEKTTLATESWRFATSTPSTPG